ncbi:hypothetical protein MRX96_057895 [Rhipicephalus microplus]
MKKRRESRHRAWSSSSLEYNKHALKGRQKPSPRPQSRVLGPWKKACQGEEGFQPRLFNETCQKSSSCTTPCFKVRCCRLTDKPWSKDSMRSFEEVLELADILDAKQQKVKISEEDMKMLCKLENDIGKVLKFK